MSVNKHGVYFGVNVAGGYFRIFSRWHTQDTLPGWKRAANLLGSDCINGDELCWQIDDVIKDLERLKKWAVRYGKSEKYEQDRHEAWTGKKRRSSVDDYDGLVLK